MKLKNIFLIFLIFFLFIIFSCHKININYPTAVKGILDLSGWDFENDLKLNGEWEFYWNKLLEPSDFNNDIKPYLSGYIIVPKRWEKFKINNKNVSTYGYATYRLKIKLNLKKNIAYGLKIPSIYTAYKLWMNNDLLISNGIPGTDEKKSRPKDIPTIIFFSNDSNEIYITIQVSNFYDKQAGICYPIIFGEANHLKKDNIIRTYLDILIFGSLIIFAFFHLNLFILRKKDKSILFFTIFCFMIAIRGLFTGEYVLLSILLNFPFELQKFIEITTAIGSLTFFSLFLFSQFSEDMSKIFLYFIIICSLIYSTLLLFLPFRIYINFLIYYQILILLMGSYSIIVLIKAVINKRESSIIFFTGYMLFFIIVINDILQDILKIRGGYYSPYGLFIFIFVQAFILARKFSLSFSRMENYSLELEDKVKERTKLFEIANKDKTDFFVNIAHETKTPLTLISNYLDGYIKKYGFTNELVIIKNNFNKLLKNMIYYLDTEKIERGKILYNHNQIVDFSNILKNEIILFTEYAKNKDIKIVSNINEDIFLKIDPDAIDRIINNLLDNAIRYTKPKGKIYIDLYINNNHINFIIEDTGIGLNKEQINNIFKPYYQVSDGKTNQPGIGMGLNIVKKIIDSINAKINIESKLNEGTKITILFKKYNLTKKDEVIKNIKFNKKQPINIDLGKDIYKEGRYNVFIVEDNIELLSYLKECMKDLFNVYYAINGKDALNKIENIPKPHIIISDIMMEYMDGYQFFEVLLKDKNFKDIPFIFLTAKDSRDEKLKGLKKGAIDYISKPFLIDELIAKIDSIIRVQEALKEKNLLSLGNKFYKILENLEDGNIKTTVDEINNDINNKLYKEYGISRKEIEVISLLKLGLEHKQIADKLNISKNTVKTYITRIYKKCKVNNKIELLKILKSL